MKGQSNFKKFFLLTLFGICLFIAIEVAMPKLLSIKYGSEGLLNALTENEQSQEPVPVPTASHVERPQMMKALYMTACVAGTPSWREKLTKLIEDTELNSIIIDIKDFSGKVSYDVEGPEFVHSDSCFVRDMEDFVKVLHEKNIYVIGRVTVFQDPTYSKAHPDLAVKKKDGSIWKDKKGLSFVDVGSKPFWEHMIALAKIAYDDGFDEINFDYIRYPSDGNMTDIWFSQSDPALNKVQNLEKFFAYMRENIPQGKPIISGDLFGMTTTNNDDLNIGQKLEVALKYFDYVYPMVYPSHYPATWNGFARPAEHPGEVVKIAMQGGVNKANAASTSPKKLCPWIQDFDLGATYTPAMVRAQIQSTYDVGLDCWLLGDASNKYTPSALNPE